jgi:hypothetical protein
MRRQTDIDQSLNTAARETCCSLPDATTGLTPAYVSYFKDDAGSRIVVAG